MGKVRRAITRADEGEVRARVARAIGGTLVLHWLLDGRLVAASSADWPMTGASAILASEGIFPGRDGWEIEVRRELPAPWRWEPSPVGARVEVLTRGGKVGDCIAGADGGSFWVYASEARTAETILSLPAASLAEARERAEDECRARGLFGVVEGAPAVKEGDLFRSKNGGRVWRAAEMTGSSDGGPRWRMAMVSGEPLPCFEVERDLLDPAQWTREQATEEPAFPTDAGVESPRTPLRALAEDIAITTDADRVERSLVAWGESLKADMRASLPAPPMPSPRTTDGALTAYLLEHHRDAWRPGDDALALAIRLLDAARVRESLADGTAAVHASKMREAEAALREMTEERDAFAAEARVATGNADRLASTAATLRRERDGAKRREAEVEAEALTVARERDEARTDLATLRQGVAALAAKMGAPHG